MSMQNDETSFSTAVLTSSTCVFMSLGRSGSAAYHHQLRCVASFPWMAFCRSTVTEATNYNYYIYRGTKPYVATCGQCSMPQLVYYVTNRHQLTHSLHTYHAYDCYEVVARWFDMTFTSSQYTRYRVNQAHTTTYGFAHLSTRGMCRS